MIIYQPSQAIYVILSTVVINGIQANIPNIYANYRTCNNNLKWLNAHAVFKIHNGKKVQMVVTLFLHVTFFNLITHYEIETNSFHLYVNFSLLRTYHHNSNKLNERTKPAWKFSKFYQGLHSANFNSE